MTTPYTSAQVKELKEIGSVDLQMAKQLAKTWGKSQASMIAKCSSMGIYTKAQRDPDGRTPKLRKADIVAAIAKATQAEKLDGLEKATKAQGIGELEKAPAIALNNLLKALP